MQEKQNTGKDGDCRDDQQENDFFHGVKALRQIGCFRKAWVDGKYAMENQNTLTETKKTCCRLYNATNLKTISEVCLYAGFMAIITSIAAWFVGSREDRPHGERFGLFIGLWVPSLFILSNRLSRKADEMKSY